MLAATLIAALTLLGVLAAIGAWLINNLSTALVVALVGYLVYLERTYGPRVIGWAISVANQLLNLHLTVAEQRALADLVERKVLAAQQSIALSGDRRAFVLSEVAQVFPAASPAKVDSLIAAAIATARLQHDGAWDKLAPMSANAAEPAIDVEALKREAFQAGQQAIMTLISGAVQPPIPAPPTVPAPEAQAPAPVPAL